MKCSTICIVPEPGGYPKGQKRSDQTATTAASTFHRSRWSHPKAMKVICYHTNDKEKNHHLKHILSDGKRVRTGDIIFASPRYPSISHVSRGPLNNFYSVHPNIYEPNDPHDKRWPDRKQLFLERAANTYSSRAPSDACR